MKFTRKTDYALRLMEALGRAEGRQPIPLKTIGQSRDMGLKFLQSVAADLARGGLIKSKTGPHGGIVLTRDPGQISLLEIIECVEGKINLMDCLDHPSVCSVHSGCSIMSVLHTAQGALVSALRATSLKLMVGAKQDPFARVPSGHYQSPAAPCPVLQ